MRVARPDGDWLPAKAALIILCFPERFHLPRDRRKRPLHMLVEGFNVFGVQVQYWMLIAALIIAVAVAFGTRR